MQVYELVDGTWVQLGADIFGGTFRDELGWSLSLSTDGTILAAGAPQRFLDTQTGYVRVYKWNGSSWVQLGSTLFGDLRDLFGESSALSADGTILAVGAPQDEDPRGGYVRAYKWDGSSWVQLGNTLFAKAEYDEFGESMALSADGTILAVGASQGSEKKGDVRVFELKSGTPCSDAGFGTPCWVQLGSTIVGNAAGDRFGWSVSLSGDGTIVAGGAIGNVAHNGGAIGGGDEDFGYYLVFKYDGTAWAQLGETILGKAAGARFGEAVSLSADGNRIALSAPLNDDGGSNSGVVRMYELTSAQSWTQVCADIIGESGGHKFGRRHIALSDDGACVAAGSPYASGGRGHARAFTCESRDISMGGDPFIRLPNRRDPVFVDMPTDGTFVDLVAHTLNFTVAASAFSLPDDPPDVSYMHAIRFQQDGHPAVDLVADDVHQ